MWENGLQSGQVQQSFRDIWRTAYTDLALNASAHASLLLAVPIVIKSLRPTMTLQNTLDTEDYILHCMLSGHGDRLSVVEHTLMLSVPQKSLVLPDDMGVAWPHQPCHVCWYEHHPHVRPL